MPKTEEERMQGVINRDTNILGRVTNAAIDMGRGIVGKPSIWHEVREWEARQEVAFAHGIEQTLASEAQAATRPTTQSPAQVADHLAAEMLRGVTPERAAAVHALEELADRMDIANEAPPYITVGSWEDEAYEVENLAPWEDLYAMVGAVETNRMAMEMLNARGIAMTDHGMLAKTEMPSLMQNVTAADIRAIVQAEHGRDDPNLTMPTERVSARVIGGR
jgi:hypothetical protein